MSLINHFEGMSTERLEREKLHYEQIIAQQHPDFVGPVNKATGRRMIPAKMPWMVPHWKKGLSLIVRELAKRKNEHN